MFDHLAHNAMIDSVQWECSSLPCHIPSLPPGQEIVLVISAEPDFGDPFLLDASVFADQYDEDTGNNRASLTGQASPTTDIRASYIDEPVGPFHIGEPVDFTAQIYNHGPVHSGPLDIVLESSNVEVIHAASARCPSLPCALEGMELGQANGELMQISVRSVSTGPFHVRIRAIPESYDFMSYNNDDSFLGQAQGTVVPGVFSDGFESD